jgi:LPXTG-motif cell wall-anchored protein
MPRNLFSRLGAAVVATALVAGGSLLAAAPASAADDIVTPSSVVENTWGPEGSITVSGTGTPGDSLVVSVLDSNDPTVAKSYLANSAVGEATVLEDGTYSITFSLSDDPATSDFWRAPALEDTVFAAVVNQTSDVAPIFLPIEVTEFVPNPFSTSIDPICLSGTDAETVGVAVTATGFDQLEQGVTYTLTDAAGTQIGDADPVQVDITGTTGGRLTLGSTIDGVPSGPIADGVYTITFHGSVTTAGLVTIGGCEPIEAAAVPTAVAPATPQLANTGSADAGTLVGGSAFLLLVGAGLVAARRRQSVPA